MPNKEFKIRSPHQQDIQNVLDLIVTNDIAEHGSPDYEIADLKADWAAVNMQKDIWLAHNKNDVLIGYAIVMEPWDKFQFEFYTHPDTKVKNLGSTLLALCESRALDILALPNNKIKNEAIMYISHGVKDNQMAVESAGFKVQKHYYRMQHKNQPNISPVIWPKHAEIRKFEFNQHLEATHRFIYEAFDWPGRDSIPDYDKWKKFMTNPDIFIPEIWFLLFYEEEIIAAALCFNFPETAWVRQIGIKKSWRGNGLGKLMMSHIYSQMYIRGFEKTSLAVESDNPKAVAFYQAIGMDIERQHDEYGKILKNSINQI